MSNSKLVDYTKISPHKTSPRTGTIKGVAIHTMAGDLSVETCGQVFQTREASSHYGIGSDGRIGQYVDEKDRAWCTSNKIDHYLVTIEMAASVAADPWPCSDAAYKSLIKLLADICQRNGIKKLLWQGDKSLMGQWDKQNMVVHRWTAAKACPGDYLYNRHGQIAREVNAILAGEEKEEEDVDINELIARMTNEQAYALVQKAQTYTAGLAEPVWSQTDGHWARAKAAGLIDGSAPERYMKRDEVIAVLGRKGLL